VAKVTKYRFWSVEKNRSIPVVFNFPIFIAICVFNAASVTLSAVSFFVKYCHHRAPNISRTLSDTGTG
jgi:hypothetical protein